MDFFFSRVQCTFSIYSLFDFWVDKKKYIEAKAREKKTKKKSEIWNLFQSLLKMETMKRKEKAHTHILWGSDTKKRKKIDYKKREGKQNKFTNKNVLQAEQFSYTKSVNKIHL